MKLALGLLLALAPSPLLAQVPWAPPPEVQASTEAAKLKRLKEEAPPLALALDLAFGATIWAEVRISTEGPVVEVSRLVKQGYYKLEIIQLVLMSAQAKRPLKETLKKRRRGTRLSEIAAEYRLDYDRIYESALAVQELVDREYLPRFREKRPRPEREEQ